MPETVSCAANVAASVGSLQMVGSSRGLRGGGIGQRGRYRAGEVIADRSFLLKKELYKNIHFTPVFIASLLIITKLWKQPQCLLMDKENVANR